MTKSLVIVESPTKANTIKKYLGRDFQVRATVGHIRDLPKKQLGVDIENDFAPVYETIKGKKKVIDEIIKAAQGCQVVYLAPDPDREGEAIAWHVQEAILGATGQKKKGAKGAAGPAIHRVLFHEITKSAVREALAHPKVIDVNRYEAQQARRILDRLVGYQVSPLLWDKVRRGLSAGRVQSVALRIICEREAAIAAFSAEEYWSIVASLEGRLPPRFEAKLAMWQGKKLALGNADASAAVVAALTGVPFTIDDIERKERKRNAAPPFITSKLQQEAARKLGFTAKKTMMLAQRLYEGIDVGDEEPAGLITYMRTDSVRISETALAAVREVIKEKYGPEYLPTKPHYYKNKKGVQDAHEAIRPTMLEHPPEQIKGYLEKDMWRLYDLIWKRFLASQMLPARFDQTTFHISAGEGLFRATGSVMTFDGFIAIYLEGIDDTPETDEEANATLPALTVGETLTCHAIDPHQHFTQPPPRFTEASLVKEMEEDGIGRPSTYAAIMSNIQDKGYVEKDQGRFRPTDLGGLVNELLVESFPDVFDVTFTARMEGELDDVEEGKRKWVEALNDFYVPFAKTLAHAKVQMRDVKRQELPTEHACEKCGNPMVIKWGRHGEFLACSGYPECKTTTEFKRVDGKIVMVGDEATDEQCPACAAAMVVKRGRFGKFLACSRYPDCKTTRAIPIGVKCPDDGANLVQRRTKRGRTFFGCENYPRCTFASWDKPIPEPCPTCHHPFLVEKVTKKEGMTIRCPQKECGYRRSPAG